ncbi:hypothetical protein OU994_18045 [Pseudoduganella sp. SL102]|uniref:glycine-rich domain-containing protein n=1 Tax=Pseudoduganella sp. SL102 TaxID=2995154 RepID=UPI00248C985C|nr:hypothetical protein [Pseudoduganella sp. SL102]WBS00223.1 hypothetical protein OU994_18045 [Pseudoduganella sp. SL102]
MPVESGSFIDDLNPAYPTAGDPKNEGDDHLRLLKALLKATFPNIDGAIAATDEELSKLSGLLASTAELNILDGVTANAAELNILDGATLTTAELNHVDGVTSPIQAQLNAKAPLSSPVFTDVPRAPTAPPNTNTTQIATTAFVTQQAFFASLPAMAGKNGRFLCTPDGINATWEQAPNQMIRQWKNANYMVAFADRASIIDCTGNITLSFDAMATLGSGWFVYVRNADLGNVNIPSSDGVTNWIMYPGEVRLFQCDGSQLRSVVLRPFYKVFTSAGNFIKPPGYDTFEGILWGAGQSGNKSSAGAPASGGAGAGGAPFNIPASRLAASEAVVIGAGGVPKATSGAGNAGGDSTFAGIVAYGGSGNAGGTAYYANNTGDNTTRGGSGSSNSPSAAVYGAAGGQGISSDIPVPMPGSTFGGAGGVASLTGNGGDGAAPGGGGGATQTGAQSGAGARGELRIWGQ